MNCRGELVTREATERVQFIINLVGTCDAADITDEASFGLDLDNEVSVSRVGVLNSNVKLKVDSFTLSKKWGISPDIAKKTLQVTTQIFIRTVLHSSLSQIFRTNDQALRYQRLPHNGFEDT